MSAPSSACLSVFIPFHVHCQVAAGSHSARLHLHHLCVYSVSCPVSGCCWGSPCSSSSLFQSLFRFLSYVRLLMGSPFSSSSSPFQSLFRFLSYVRLLLGFTLLVFTFSMWMGNIAITSLMLPICVSVADTLYECSPQEKGMLHHQPHATYLWPTRCMNAAHKKHVFNILENIRGCHLQMSKLLLYNNLLRS